MALSTRPVYTRSSPQGYDQVSPVPHINSLTPQITSSPPSRDRRKYEFVYTRPHCTTSFHIGKVIKKSDSLCYVAHWTTHQDGCTISPCSRCSMHHPGHHKWPLDSCITAYSYNVLRVITGIRPASCPERKLFPFSIFNYNRHSYPAFNSPQVSESPLFGMLTVQPREVEYIRSCIIDQHIADSLTQHALTNIFLAQQGTTTFTYFTDGSLVSYGESPANMGIGWTNDSYTQTFSCGIDQWPSSTRAELGAIWTALLTVPCDTTAHIKTDSQAAIDGIKECLHNPAIVKWHSVTNPTIKMLIVDCVRSKHLKLHFTKIKGHSGNHGNELADQLAKKGTMDTHILTFNFDLLDRFNFCFNFYSFRPFFNDISIENNVRHTIRSINRSMVESHWATSKAAREPFCISNYLIEQYTWASFASVRQRRCISLQHHNHWIFCTKLINNLLPTTARLNLYTNNTFSNWTCALCNQGKDDIEHLCICSHTKEEWNTILLKLTKMVSKFLQQHELNSDARSLILSLFPNDSALPTLTTYCRHNWLKGFISAPTVALIRRRTKLSSLSHSLTLKIISKTQVLFRRLIWSKRCQAQKDKEFKAGINISNIVKTKRLQAKSKRTNRHPKDFGHHPLTNTHLPDDIENECICLDDVAPSSTLAFRPDREGMARDWFIDGMKDWFVKGIRASWMYINKGTIGKLGNNLVRNFALRSNMAQILDLNSDHGALHG